MSRAGRVALTALASTLPAALLSTNPAWSENHKPCGYLCERAPAVTTTDTGIQGERHVPGFVPATLDREGGDACTTCEWAIVPACPSNGVNGSANVDSGCTGTRAGCRPGETRFRVYFRRSPADPWRVAGAECIGPGAAPAGTLDLGLLASNFLDRMDLPLPSPSVQPADGALVNMPAIFSAGSGDPVTATLDLGGLAVTVTARPAYWDWAFEPGVTQRFYRPGGAYPDKDVTYTYRTTGHVRVTVTATWTATYRVGDGPEQPVVGAVRRAGPPLDVLVREARSELVEG